MRITIVVSIIVLMVPLSSRADDDLALLRFPAQLSGYFFAQSAIPDEAAFGGFGKSDNKPHRVVGESVSSQPQIVLVALPDEVAVFALDSTGKYPVERVTLESKTFKGFKVLLLNETPDVVWFSATDSRLSVVREAMDQSGEWKPIEALPGSSCGNSYHRVALEPNQYWSFSAPAYAGEFLTKMRFRLDDTVSNEFEGTMVLSQFGTALRANIHETVPSPSLV